MAVFSGYTGYHLALTWDWELARDWEGVSGVCWAGRLQRQEAVSLPPSRHRQPHSDYLLQISSHLGTSCLGRGDQHSMIYVHWCWRVFPLPILFLNWFVHILSKSEIIHWQSGYQEAERSTQTIIRLVNTGDDKQSGVILVMTRTLRRFLPILDLAPPPTHPCLPHTERNC